MGRRIGEGVDGKKNRRRRYGRGGGTRVWGEHNEE
jgi:hypothetical protein